MNFPGHFSAFPEIYYPNDMGQKSDAVFAGMHFIKCAPFDALFSCCSWVESRKPQKWSILRADVDELVAWSRYYDATQSLTFLRERAYPYLRLVADL